jgi:uncharacterized membrane protein
MRMSRARLMWHVSWASMVLLVLLQCVESLRQQPPLIVAIMRVLPLLIFVPGMWVDRLRSYLWLCFVCLLYFMALVLRLFAEPTNMVAMLAMVSVVSLFISAMLYVRWRARELREQS